MRIETAADQLLFTTLRIETDRSIGTGFIVSYSWPNQSSGDELTGMFLISNKHVVGDSTCGRFTLTRTCKDDSDLTLGNHDIVDIDAGFWRYWMHHPAVDVDVAALPLNPIFNSMDDMGSSVFFKCFSPADFPSADTLEELDSLEEVVFVGYPNNVYDRTNNLPVFRKGITATPANVDYEGKPVFLIDASVFPGSSGSPVFIYNVGSWNKRSGAVLGSERVVFLGVLAAVLYRNEDGIIEFVEAPTSHVPVVKTKEMIDLGVVYKARTILETLEHGLRQFGQFQ